MRHNLYTLTLIDLSQRMVSRGIAFIYAPTPVRTAESGKNLFSCSICQSYHKIGLFFKFRIILACVLLSPDRRLSSLAILHIHKHIDDIITEFTLLRVDVLPFACKPPVFDIVHYQDG